MRQIALKLLLVTVLTAASATAIINSNWYPFGYPVEQGQYWKVVHTFHKGTPIESKSIWKVYIDSTFQGYIIKATEPDGQFYTRGMTMREFMMDADRQITKEEFKIIEK